MKSDEPYLEHILEEIDFLAKNFKGVEFQSFMRDEVLKRACARSLEIIGEAVKNLSPAFKAKHKDIEWKKIAGLRDKLIHYYFGVNWDIVWVVIQNKLPELKATIKSALKKNQT